MDGRAHGSMHEGGRHVRGHQRRNGKGHGRRFREKHMEGDIAGGMLEMHCFSVV